MRVCQSGLLHDILRLDSTHSEPVEYGIIIQLYQTVQNLNASQFPTINCINYYAFTPDSFWSDFGLRQTIVEKIDHVSNTHSDC
jgi:hypothetical protein